MKVWSLWFIWVHFPVYDYWPVYSGSFTRNFLLFFRYFLLFFRKKNEIVLANHAMRKIPPRRIFPSYEDMYEPILVYPCHRHYFSWHIINLYHIFMTCSRGWSGWRQSLHLDQSVHSGPSWSPLIISIQTIHAKTILNIISYQNHT